MIVRKSTADDVESILKVIDVARLIMRKSGNQSQWVDGYPDKACFLCDINADCSFVIEKEGRVGGTFALIKACGSTSITPANSDNGFPVSTITSNK